MSSGRRYRHLNLQNLPTCQEIIIGDESALKQEKPKEKISCAYFLDKDPIPLILMILSFLLYFYSLQGCKNTDELICISELASQIPRYSLCLFFAAFIPALIIYYIIWQEISVRHFISVFIIVFLTYLISGGKTFNDHGTYNLTVFFGFLIWNLILLNVLKLLNTIMKRYPKTVIGVLIFIFLSFSLFFLIIWFANTCSDWNVGFKNTHVSDENCRMPTPRICYHNIADNWFDFSKLFDQNNCSKVESKKKIYPEYADFLAYPKTQNLIREQRKPDIFQKNVFDRIKPVTEEEIISEKHEVILDQRNNDSIVHINVFRDESLVNRSNQIINSYKFAKPLARNIITIFIDSVSRQHFSLKLKKTYEWLESHYLSSESSLESFQFFKYHASEEQSISNISRLFYGTDRVRPHKKLSLIQSFKDKGYITAQSNNLCGATYLETSQNKSFENLDSEPYDHENLGLFCDPNYQKNSQKNGYCELDGSYSMVRRCLYGKDTHQYVIEYGEKFWDTYENQPKMLELGFTESKELSNELIQYLDEPLYMFLSNLEKNGKINDTAIVFYSDRGQFANLFYYMFKLRDLGYERKLPLFFVMLPRKLADTFGENLRSYEQNLISIYDIYNLLNILAGSDSRSENGINILEKSEVSRCCLDLMLLKEFCICK